MTNASSPAASSSRIREQMARQRQRNTGPEIALRSALFGAGRRFRVHHQIYGVRREIDIAFTRAKVAVDVRGCFWHACPEHGNLPIANRHWWSLKLVSNRERDEKTVGLLAAAGWRLVVVWEHEDVSIATARIERVLDGDAAAGWGDKERLSRHE